MIHRPFYPLVDGIIERDSFGRGRKGVVCTNYMWATFFFYFVCLPTDELVPRRQNNNSS